MSENVKIEQMAFDHLVELLEKKDFRKHLVKALNEDVDIPIINEKTEGKVMEAIYKQIVKAIKTIDICEMN
tara:strand:- start:8678 stop:8890 length:213 start_codon:yes stop_codon:yes gene_type:complete